MKVEVLTSIVPGAPRWIVDGVPSEPLGECRKGCGALQFLPSALSDDAHWSLAALDTTHERTCTGK